MSFSRDCVGSVYSSSNGPDPKAIKKKRWSDTENRIARAHADDGYLLIAETLAAQGYERTPESVRHHMRRDLGIGVRKYPSSGNRKCVSCGKWDARPGTQAGNAGFCPTCWERRKHEAYLEGREELSARRAYRREKKHRYDRKRGRSEGRGTEEQR